MRLGIIVFCVVILTSFAATSAEAQLSVGPMVGWMENNDENGIGIGGRALYGLTDMFSVDGRLSYVFATDSDDDSTVIPLEVGVIAQTDIGNGSAYGGIGVGYYLYDLDMPSGYGLDDSPEEFGYYLVAGWIKTLESGAQVFVEGKYTNAEFEERSDTYYGSGPGYYYYGWTEVEGGLDGFGINAGIMWPL